LLPDDFVVFGMASDPKPGDAILNVDTDSTPMQPDTSRPKFADLLEVSGRMTRIGIHERKASIRKLLYIAWQSATVIPEIRSSKMIQSFVLLPSR
jgi:hypothetical protein